MDHNLVTHKSLESFKLVISSHHLCLIRILINMIPIIERCFTTAMFVVNLIKTGEKLRRRSCKIEFKYEYELTNVGCWALAWCRPLVLTLELSCLMTRSF